jgi:hypothetical protein
VRLTVVEDDVLNGPPLIPAGHSRPTEFSVALLQRRRHAPLRETPLPPRRKTASSRRRFFSLSEGSCP